MSTLLISGGEVLTPFEAIPDGAVFARDGVIERIGPRAAFAGGRGDIEVDAAGRLICPGFVDLQVNGGGGALVIEEPSPETVGRIAAAHLRFGTTALLAAVTTSEERRMAEALAAVAESVRRPGSGARVLGAHLEGPFLSMPRRGAHPKRFVQEPEPALFERLLEASAGALRVITLAPELPGAHDLIRASLEASVAVAIGHTDATYAEARAAIEAGATLATHLFNAMRPLHQREPGAIGAVLESEQVIATVIADGVHVHPSLLSLAHRAKGAEGVALVTDAMPAAAAEGTSFPFEGTEIVVRDGACYLPDGTLAGSALTMDRAVRNMRRLAGVRLLDCVRMATATPARALGLQGEIGALKAGARADIVVCDHDLNVWRVFTGGAQVYAAP